MNPIQLNEQYVPHYREDRPWGYFVVVYDAPHTKVKELVVSPGSRLSYQMHHKRREHWLVVVGEATVTLDDVVHIVKAGESVDVPIGVKHRIANMGTMPLRLIEIQTGDYFGEDDIVRFSDDYNRADVV